MEVVESQEAGFKLLDFKIVKINFEQEQAFVTQEHSDLDVSLNVRSTIDKSSLNITTELELNIGHKSDKSELMKLEINSRSVFSASQVYDLNQIENFAKLNAPAIIYPLVRASIASISIGVGINVIVLPIINFHKVQTEVKYI